MYNTKQEYVPQRRKCTTVKGKMHENKQGNEQEIVQQQARKFTTFNRKSVQQYTG